MKRMIVWILLVTAVVLVADGSSWAAPVAATRTSDIITKGPWVDSRAYSSLSAADTAAAAAGKELQITQNYTINSAITFTSHVRVVPGGGFTHSGGGLITFSGGFECRKDTQAFYGFSAGDITGMKVARPEWFGNVSSAFAAAFNLAGSILSANGGELILQGQGYTADDTLQVYSKVSYSGVGKNATIITAKNGLNKSLIKSASYDSLTGTNSLGGDYSFVIQNIVFDGNSANNTSGDGVTIYGYSFTLRDLVIRNFAGNGLVTEWSSSAGWPAVNLDFVEAHVSNCSIHDNQGSGVIWNGPHDSTWDNNVIYYNHGTYGVRVGSNAGPLYATNCHVWGSWTQYAWYLAGRAMLNNCVGEMSSVAQVYIGADNSSIYSGEYFADGLVNTKGLVFANGVKGADVVTITRNLIGGAIDLGTGPTTSKIIINNSQTSGTPRLGTLPTDGLYSFNSAGGVSGYSTTRFPSIPQAVDTNGVTRNLVAMGAAAVSTVAGAQTIDVLGKDMLEITSSVAASIYNFTNASTGQEITLLFRDGNTTITNGATIKLAGGVNFVATANDTLKLKYSATSGAWFQTGGSVN